MSEPHPVSNDRLHGRPFPNADSLCETCGYRLQGLPPEGNCPECGTAIQASHPDHRPGLLWQQRQTLRTWWTTNWCVMMHPKQSFRRMNTGGSSDEEFMFFITNGFVASMIYIISWFGVVRRYGGPPVGTESLPFCCSVFPAIAVLTFLEAIGITHFSGKRGWRIPFRKSFRLCAYCSAGWFPGVLLLVTITLPTPKEVISGWIDLLPTGLPVPTWFLFWAGVFAVTVLPFEILSSIGMRQIRYANAP